MREHAPAGRARGRPADGGSAAFLAAFAGLLACGVAEAPALTAVASTMAPTCPPARAVGARLHPGAPPTDAVRAAAEDPGLGPRDRLALGWLAEVLLVAHPLGLPLVDLLTGLAEEVAAEEGDHAQAQAAAAGPRASALVLSAMPLGALALGAALGAHPWAVLVGTGVGRACLVLGGLAWGLGFWWMRRIVAAVVPGS
ncbi:MAG: hypothetical protein U0Q15_07920 [Kineosporiaceae bacterium]